MDRDYRPSRFRRLVPIASAIALVTFVGVSRFGEAVVQSMVGGIDLVLSSSLELMIGGPSETMGLGAVVLVGAIVTVVGLQLILFASLTGLHLISLHSRLRSDLNTFLS